MSDQPEIETITSNWRKQIVRLMINFKTLNNDFRTSPQIFFSPYNCKPLKTEAKKNIFKNYLILSERYF